MGTGNQGPALESLLQWSLRLTVGKPGYQGHVRDVWIQGPEIYGTFADGRSFQTYAPNDPSLVQRLYAKGVSITARAQQNELPWFVLLAMSWLAFSAFIWAWVFSVNTIATAIHRLEEAVLAAGRGSDPAGRGK
jgi:hypothetical protein